MRILLLCTITVVLVALSQAEQESEVSLQRAAREADAQPKTRRRKHKKAKNQRRKNQKKYGRKNPKNRRNWGRKQKPHARQGIVIKGNNCEYIFLADITSNSGCTTGNKFVLKGADGVRKQFLILNSKTTLAFVTKGVKFTACTTFTDITTTVKCKEVTGLASVNLGSTGSADATTAAAAATTAAAGATTATAGASTAPAGASTAPAGATTAAAGATTAAVGATTASDGATTAAAGATSVAAGATTAAAGATTAAAGATTAAGSASSLDAVLGKRMNLTHAAHAAYGYVELVSATTVRLTQLYYDGAGPKTNWIVGTKSSIGVDSDTVIIDGLTASGEALYPDPTDLSSAVPSLPAYDNNSILLTLPIKQGKQMTWSDVSWIALYCRQVSMLFMSARIPESFGTIRGENES